MKSFLRYFVIIFIVNVICKHTGIYDQINAFLDDTVPANAEAINRWVSGLPSMAWTVIGMALGMIVPIIAFRVLRALRGDL